MLVAMKGHPGCGKSSLARSLGKALGWPVLDKDDIRDCTFPLEHHQRVPAPFLNSFSYRALWRLVETQLEMGLSVIVDCPLSRPSLFLSAASLARRHSMRLLLIECVASDIDEWKRRLQGRRAAADASAAAQPGMDQKGQQYQETLGMTKRLSLSSSEQLARGVNIKDGSAGAGGVSEGAMVAEGVFNLAEEEIGEQRPEDMDIRGEKDEEEEEEEGIKATAASAAGEIHASQRVGEEETCQENIHVRKSFLNEKEHASYLSHATKGFTASPPPEAGGSYGNQDMDIVNDTRKSIGFQEACFRGWHKPDSWENLQKLIQSYGNCWDYDTSVSSKKLVVDTTASHHDALVSGALEWIRVMSDETPTVTYLTK